MATKTDARTLELIKKRAIVGGGGSSITGITGTKAEYNTSLTDGNFQYMDQLIVEPRTSDPGSPEVGRIWLRTDL